MSYTFPTLGTVIGTLLPSGDPTGATDTIALQALLNQGPGTVQLAAGTFYIANVSSSLYGVLSAAYPPQRIVGAGRGQTILMAVAGFTGDVISMYNQTPPSGGTWQGLTVWGGGVQGLTINGVLTTAACNGLHIGDGEEYDIDVQIMNFATTGSNGLLLDNRYWWTEKAHVRAALSGNATACTITVSPSSGGSNSFEYNDLSLDIFTTGTQQGLVIQDGAYLNNCNLRIRGNMQCGVSITPGTCLTVTGVNTTVTPNVYSHISCTFLDIAIESDPIAGENAYPQTIEFGGLNR